jgi:hypothetical protein
MEYFHQARSGMLKGARLSTGGGDTEETYADIALLPNLENTGSLSKNSLGRIAGWQGTESCGITQSFELTK